MKLICFILACILACSAWTTINVQAVTCSDGMVLEISDDSALAFSEFMAEFTGWPLVCAETETPVVHETGPPISNNLEEHCVTVCGGECRRHQRCMARSGVF